MTAHRSGRPRRVSVGLGPAAAGCTLLGVLTAAWPAALGVPGTPPVLAAGGPAGSSVASGAAPDPTAIPLRVAGAGRATGAERVGAAAGIPVTYADAAPDAARVRVAIEFALAQLGLPYVWGGNGPAAGHAGFDCSGLTTASYAAAGVRLPRTAHTQFYAGPHVPTGAALYPGDLVFYGVPSRVHHVGLYLGEGRMVAAPTFGKPVRVSYFRWRGDDFLGATRPAGTGLRGGICLPFPHRFRVQSCRRR